jgi:hypothetical protein
MNDKLKEKPELAVVRFSDSEGLPAGSGIPVYEPAFEAESFAELETRVRSCDLRAPEWRDAGIWALETLKEILGETWPGDTWAKTAKSGDPWLPPDLGASHYHTRHYARLLELALRLKEFEDTPGIALIRDHLRGDRTIDRWEHTLVQLELAALGRQAGAHVTLEGAATPGERRPDGAWPADVRLTTGDLVIPLEAFAVLTSEQWREDAKRSEDIAMRLDAIMDHHGVQCEVDFCGETLKADGALDRFFRDIEYGVAIAAAGEQRYVAREGKARALIGLDVQRRINGPPITEPGNLRRARYSLQKKRDQIANTADGVWLRVDLLDGTWQFTPWSQDNIAAKIEQLAAQIRDAFGQSLDGVAGVLVSSGVCQDYTTLGEETHDCQDGQSALRCVMPPSRARELMIIPLDPEAGEAAQFLRSMYENERGWLRRALSKAGLGTYESIFECPT